VTARGQAGGMKGKLRKPAFVFPGFDRDSVLFGELPLPGFDANSVTFEELLLPGFNDESVRFGEIPLPGFDAESVLFSEVTRKVIKISTLKGEL